MIERERAIYTEQATASGKSAEIVAKMVEGRLRKEFYQQVVLLQQTFLGAGGDGKQTVDQVLQEADKKLERPSELPSSCAMLWVRASTRRMMTSPPRWPRPPAARPIGRFD